MLLSNKIPCKIANEIVDKNGRYVICDLLFEQKTITLASIYAPNVDSPEYFEQINAKLQERSENLIIIGDYNLTICDSLDRLNTTNKNENARQVVQKMMETLKVCDIWRVRHENDKEFSWVKMNSKTKECKASQLDLCLISQGLEQSVDLCMYMTSYQTDHRSLLITINICKNERGNGYWKLNTKLFENSEFITWLRANITKDIECCKELDPIQKWEKIKCRIKQDVVKYARKRSNENDLVISQLNEKIQLYESNLPLEKSDYEKYEKSKQEFEQLMSERANSIRFRSKARWYLEGEKGTKYFLNLEKRNYNAKTCFTLFREDGTLTSTSGEILDIQADYYEKLYQRDLNVNFTLQNETGIKVSQKHCKNEQITFVELTEAVKQLKNNKTPGQDGLPTELYKIFWEQLGPVLYQCILECYKREILYPTARQGILNLIPKNNKDSRKVENLRPITLLNVDYKILEKAMSNRLLKGLSEIINSDQRGFLPQRRISVNVRKMLDIVEQYNENETTKGGVIVSCDFNKCFDRVSFESIKQSLVYHGFDDVMIKWSEIFVQKFYS